MAGLGGMTGKVLTGTIGGLVSQGGKLLSGIPGLFKWGGITALTVGGTATALNGAGVKADPNNPNNGAVEALSNPTDTAIDVAQRGAEGLELTEHFAGSYDAIMNPKKWAMGIASFVEAIALAFGLEDIAEKARGYYMSQMLDVKNFGNSRADFEQQTYNAEEAERRTRDGTDIQAPGLNMGNIALGGGAAVLGGTLAAKSFLGGKPATPVTPATGAVDDAAKVAATTGDDAARLAAATGDDAARLAALQAGDNLFPNLARTAGTNQITMEVAETAAKASTKLPGWLKIFGIGTAVVTTGALAIADANNSQAQAAVDPNVSTDDLITAGTNNPGGALHMEIPVSVDAAGATAGLITAATVGGKALPLVSAGIYGAETLYESGTYAGDGDYGRMTLAFLAGAGPTVGGFFGAPGAALGEAWHASVRDGSIAVFGEDATINKSQLRQLGELGVDIGGDLMGAMFQPAPLSEENQAFYDLYDAIPGAATADMPPELQSLIELKTNIVNAQAAYDQSWGTNRAEIEMTLQSAERMYEQQLEELTTSGGIQHALAYLSQQNPADGQTAVAAAPAAPAAFVLPTDHFLLAANNKTATVNADMPAFNPNVGGAGITDMNANDTKVRQLVNGGLEYTP